MQPSHPRAFRAPHRMREESPGRLGPFVIMVWVENSGDLVDILNKPGLSNKDVPMLDPNIDEQKLEQAYSQMAGIVLQLALCELPVNGSLNFPDRNDENDPAMLT